MDKNKLYDPLHGCIVDESEYAIGEDTDGHTATAKQLHDVVLSIILEFDRVCRKNNIPYALGFGSALGLHNYQGFIPWDDDADIVVMYEDLTRLVTALKSDLGPNFSFDAYENDRRYNVLIPTMKVRRVDTFIREKNYISLPDKCNKEAGIFIDICVFMGVPENLKEHQRLLRYAKTRMPLYVLLDGWLRLPMYGLKKKLKRFEQKTAEKYKASPVVSQTVIIPWQDWNRVVSLNAFPREVILPFKEYTFEGYPIFSFHDVEKFASLRYGQRALRKWDGKKWVDPFPAARRKVGHIEAFNLNHSLKK